ncbi:hypothetical protein [Endothiovibrio diazotrophicus]
MFDFRFDGAEGVAQLPGILASLAEPIAGVAAEEYTEAVLDWIGAGKVSTKSSGLEQGIGWIAAAGGAVEVFSASSRSRWIEEGTRPHVIKPRPGRQALKIPTPGGYILRRQVNHPGTKAQPFFFADLANRQERMKAGILRFVAAQTGAEQ